MKKKKNPILGWIWPAIIIIAVIGLVKHFNIKNFKTVKPGILYTSGQPRGMDYTRLLYKYHIATFVNLRNPDEHREDNWYNEETAWMKNNGVEYVEMPLEKDVFDDAIPDTNETRQFLQIMSDKTNLPVLLHDSSGKKRVSYLASIWMLRSGGFNLDQTVEKVKQIKGQPVTEQEMEFLKSLVH